MGAELVSMLVVAAVSALVFAAAVAVVQVAPAAVVVVVESVVVVAAYFAGLISCWVYLMEFFLHWESGRQDW